MTFEEIKRKLTNPALIGYVILGGGIVGGFLVNENHNQDSRQQIVQSGQAVAVVGCNRDFNQTTELRRIISQGRTRVALALKEGSITNAEADRAYEAADEALRRLKVPDCRDVFDQLSDDPNEKIVVPDPLHTKGE